ncbi:MAG: DUF2093 domain-containing protein [Rhizobiales bacterium]|nr:DUF2093 domain-containing protein [Hyphomicrobiales bacterium]
MLDQMNPAGGKPAVIKYGDNDYHVLQRGTYVKCAITGKAISLDELRYWSVARQEAYIDAHASLKAEMAAKA